MERGTKSRRGREGRRVWNCGRGPGSSARDGWLYLDMCFGAHQVPSYAAADGVGLPTRGQFEG